MLLALGSPHGLETNDLPQTKTLSIKLNAESLTTTDILIQAQEVGPPLWLGFSLIKKFLHLLSR
jgi:hypothetical protein